MRLSAKALAYTIGLLWGGAMFLIGVLNMLIPPYGADLLVVLGSVYPGVFGAGTLQEALLATVYGVVDGALAGWLIAWVYNFFAERSKS
jgi:hypothetical protein